MTFLGLGSGNTSFPPSTLGSKLVSRVPATFVEPYSVEPVDDSAAWCGCGKSGEKPGCGTEGESFDE